MRGSLFLQFCWWLRTFLAVHDERSRVASNAEIDRLGERLREDPSDAVLLGRLFTYCQEMRMRTARVAASVRDSTILPVSPRDGKSFLSILDKLNRREVKLSAMQDIEGCRILVDSTVDQDAVTFRVRSMVSDSRVLDRRKSSRSGYRAVHVVVSEAGARYEVQIRTLLQHLWAEVSERLAASYGNELKYGGKPNSEIGVRTALALEKLSREIADVEAYELSVWEVLTGAVYGPREEKVKRVEKFLGESAFEIFSGADPEDWARWAQSRIQRIKNGLKSDLLDLIRRLESGEAGAM